MSSLVTHSQTLLTSVPEVAAYALKHSAGELALLRGWHGQAEVWPISQPVAGYPGLVSQGRWQDLQCVDIMGLAERLNPTSPHAFIREIQLALPNAAVRHWHSLAKLRTGISSHMMKCELRLTCGKSGRDPRVWYAPKNKATCLRCVKKEAGIKMKCRSQVYVVEHDDLAGEIRWLPSNIQRLAPLCKDWSLNRMCDTTVQHDRGCYCIIHGRFLN